MRRIIAIMGLTAACVLPARATPVAVVTASAYTYLPGDVDEPRLPLSVTVGGRLVFANSDADFHTVTAVDEVGGVPLFDSGAAIGLGEARDVAGVAALPPGSYIFFCTFHGSGMAGILDVVELS
jgi:plastocyanin